MVMRAPQDEACHSLHLAKKKGVRISRTVCLLLLTTVLMMRRRGAAEGAAVEGWGLRLLVGKATEAAQAMCTIGLSRRHLQPIRTGQQQHEMGRAAGSQTIGNDFKAYLAGLTARRSYVPWYSLTASSSVTLLWHAFP